jgi:hypothetical protein
MATSPIILQWSNAFDAEDNISGYELSYKTNSPSWIELPFIESSETTGTYSFTPIQQIDHTFRIRIRDEFGRVSEYQYFSYPIAPDYQISSRSLPGRDVPGENACGILDVNDVLYSPVELSSTPPAVDVIVYKNGTIFLGGSKYWIIKSPSGFNYSCKILNSGIIQQILLCGNNSGFRSSLGKTDINSTCSLTTTENIYWPGTANFVVGTLLYTNIDCTPTSIFNGNGLFYLLQYTDANELTSIKIVKVGGTGPDLGKIISVVNKLDVCRVIRAGGISAPSNTPHTATCNSVSSNTCYIVSVDDTDISVNDIVYTESTGTTRFIGGDRTYRVFIQATLRVVKLCKIDNNGKVTQTSYCSVSGGGGGGGGGGCPVPETLILLKDGKQIPAGDIKVGDKIYTLHQTTFEPGEYEVSHTEKIYQDRLRITFDDSSMIKVSDTHKFLMIDKSWKSSCKLVDGDIIKGFATDKKIISIEEIGSGEVVKFEVIDAHTYISAGLVSHNNKVIDAISNQL